MKVSHAVLAAALCVGRAAAGKAQVPPAVAPADAPAECPGAVTAGEPWTAVTDKTSGCKFYHPSADRDAVSWVAPPGVVACGAGLCGPPEPVVPQWQLFAAVFLAVFFFLAYCTAGRAGAAGGAAAAVDVEAEAMRRVTAELSKAKDSNVGAEQRANAAMAKSKEDLHALNEAAAAKEAKMAAHLKTTTDKFENVKKEKTALGKDLAAAKASLEASEAKLAKAAEATAEAKADVIKAKAAAAGADAKAKAEAATAAANLSKAGAKVAELEKKLKAAAAN